MQIPSVRQPSNERVLHHFRLRAAEDDRAPHSDGSDYLGAGTHPDVVTQLWRTLGATLPPESRRVVCGTPALLNPSTRVLIAVAIGTQYAIRIPRSILAAGAAREWRTRTVFADTGELDVREAFGDDWVLGEYAVDEPAWCRQSFDENAAAPL